MSKEKLQCNTIWPSSHTCGNCMFDYSFIDSSTNNVPFQGHYSSTQCSWCWKVARYSQFICRTLPVHLKIEFAFITLEKFYKPLLPEKGNHPIIPLSLCRINILWPSDMENHLHPTEWPCCSSWRTTSRWIWMSSIGPNYTILFLLVVTISVIYTAILQERLVIPRRGRWGGYPNNCWCAYRHFTQIWV